MITRAKKIRISRLFTQLSTLIVVNLPFLRLRMMCAPVFYCHSCPLAAMACPLGVLINFSALRIFPFVTLGILGLVGALGGRLVCGWMCPFGLLQDLLFKIRTKKFAIPHQLSYVKYALLVVFVFATPYLFRSNLYSFCYACPSSSMESTIPWAFIAHWHKVEGVFGGFTAKFFTKMAVLFGTLVFSILVSRSFCRVFCPLGAIFGLFNRFSLFRFNLAHKKCNDCGGCRKLCPTDIDPVSQMNTAECIRCNECTLTKHIKLGAK